MDEVEVVENSAETFSNFEYFGKWAKSISILKYSSGAYAAKVSQLVTDLANELKVNEYYSETLSIFGYFKERCKWVSDHRNSFGSTLRASVIG